MTYDDDHFTACGTSAMFLSLFLSAPVFWIVLIGATFVSGTGFVSAAGFAFVAGLSTYAVAFVGIYTLYRVRSVAQMSHDSLGFAAAGR